MAEHKMEILNGVRYRPEDVERARARAQADAPAGPLTTAHADPVQTPDAPPFDPAAAANADVVLQYLATADEAETLRVLDAEAEGKGRKGLLDQREQLLTAARERAENGPAA